MKKCKSCGIGMTSQNSYHNYYINRHGEKTLRFTRNDCKVCAQKKEREKYIPKCPKDKMQRVVITTFSDTLEMSTKIREYANRETGGNIAEACRRLMRTSLNEVEK